MKNSLKRAIVFPFITLLFFGCSNAEMGSEEEQLINDVFMDLVGTKGYYLPPSPPPLPLWYMENPTTDDSIKYVEEFEKFSNSLNNPVVDTSILNIFVVGLTPPDSSELRYIQLDDFQSFHQNFHMDSSWMPTYLNLPSLSTPQKLDFTLITNTGRYVIVDEETYLEEPEGTKSVAAIQISRIAFSEDHTRAVFQFSILFGPLSGGGSIIFVEKVEGSWTIVSRTNLWVA